MHHRRYSEELAITDDMGGPFHRRRTAGLTMTSCDITLLRVCDVTADSAKL